MTQHPPTTGPSDSSTVPPSTTDSTPDDTADATQHPSAAARNALDEARQRTLALVDAVPDEDLVAQHSRLMSPLVWDLAHIANQEDLWIVRQAGHRPGLRPDLDPLYDAFQHPRADRPSLPLLCPSEARQYAAVVREETWAVLAEADTTPASPDPLLADAFVFGMLAQHEQQHDETMLATHQLRKGPPVLAAPTPPAATDPHRLPRDVYIPPGAFVMGTSTAPWALDNERPHHTVDVPGYWLDTTPVTNGAYQEFIEAGGYQDPRWWIREGWQHVQKAKIQAPLFWFRDAGQWTRRRFGHIEPVPANEPVMHVCWYEANAYARWTGRRLPTEQEWEKAARYDPDTDRSRRYPWGDTDPDPQRANLGQRHLQPAAAGGYAAGEAPSGARQLIGDVWEWTSSDFTPYPGFTSFPYKEYSEVFFGPGYKVLRGGAFSVSPIVARTTFRNWDYPIRRQIFAGFRTARDATPQEKRDD
ncbi:ergothioneine biosynthesis protein EgtB [Streptomyces sp. NPDC004044]